MKIISCHIENFGKLSDFTMEFSDGINSICMKNGAGKTTLATFLRVMFFGFAGEGKQGNIENERRKYTPWQSGIYGGQVTFETQGTSYIVSRIFGKTAKSDEFRLQNAKTMLDSTDYTTNLGEELMEIDQSSYMRTIYIGQNDCKTQTTDRISAKLGDLADNTDDINNYEKVNKQFTDLLNNFSATRKTGKIARLQKEAGDIRETLRERDAIESALSQLDAQRQQTEKEREKLMLRQTQVQNELSIASKEQGNRVRKQQYEELCNEVAFRFSRVESLAAKFPKAPPTNEQLQEMRNRLKQVEQEKSKQEAQKKQSKTRFVAGFLVICLIAIFGCLITSIPKIAIVLVAIFICVGIFLVCKPKETQVEEDDIFEFFGPYEPEENLSGYSMQDYQGLLQKIEVNLQTYEAANQEYMYVLERKKKLEQEYNLQTENLQNQKSVDSCNQELTELSKKIQQIHTDIMQYDKQMEAKAKQLDDLQEQEEILHDLEQEIDTLKKKVELIKYTQSFMTQAKEQFTSKYTVPLKQGFEKYYGYLATKQEAYQLDANLNLQMKQEGMYRDIRTLSSGCQDLIDICMRMALVDAMYQQEKPFLIFDDPFVNLDEETLENAKEFLSEVAREYQLIYFTCHDSRMN